MEKSATPDEVALSPQARDALKGLRGFSKQTDAMLDRAYEGNVTLWDAETYLPHIWDLRTRGAAQRSRTSHTMMRDPYLHSRKFATYKEGIEGPEKLDPLYDDVAAVEGKRRIVASITTANQEFANDLRNLGLLINPDEGRKLRLDWPKAEESPALKRAVWVGKTKAGDDIMRMESPFINPDIKMAADAIFGSRRMPFGLAAIEQVRAIGKQLNVDASLFHHVSIGEVAQGQFATRGPRGLLGGLVTGGTELFKGMVAAPQEIAGKKPTYRPPVVSWPKELVEPWAPLLRFQTAEHEAAITEALRASAPPREGPIGKALRAPFQAIGNVSYFFNRSLFDFYQQGLMIKSANHIYSQELARLQKTTPNPSPAQIQNLREVIADHVNRSFGAESLEMLMLSPAMQNVMKFVLFAPVWTLGNIRVLTAGYDTITGKRLTDRYIAGAASSWFITTQLANYALTGWFNMPDKEGKTGPHFTWDNAGAPLKLGSKYVPGLTDNVFNIGFGWNENGTERYFRFGKPYREPFDWALNAVDTYTGKMGQVPRVAMSFFTGSEPGGFRLWDAQRASEQEKTWKRIQQVTEFFTPFSLQQWGAGAFRAAKPEYFPEQRTLGQFAGVPVRQGVSRTSAYEAYREAMDEGNTEAAKQVLAAAAQNKIAPSGIVSLYQQEMGKRKRMAAGKPFKFTSRGTPEYAKPSATAPPPVTNNGSLPSFEEIRRNAAR